MTGSMCPVCHKDDQVKRVSGVYLAQSGKSSSVRTGLTSGYIETSWFDTLIQGRPYQSFDTGSASVSYHSGINSTNLATLFSIPSGPRPPDKFGQSTGLKAMMAFIVLTFSAALGPIVAIISLPLAVLVPMLIIVMRWRHVKNDRGRYKTELQLFHKLCEVRELAYYCERDSVVFIPGLRVYDVPERFPKVLGEAVVASSAMP
jgi:hypothetical protein